MTILLTGASGLVGAAVARAAARRGHCVVGIVGNYHDELEGVARKLLLELTDETALNAAVLDVFPEAIVNCAAVSVPEACDADPARAQTLNVALPAALARLAYHLSARLVHISSEQIFDGARATPYAAGDPPSPINLYGRQKLESERAVHAAAAAFAVTIRAPLLLGDSPMAKRSTHERLFADWATGKTVKLYTDEFRQPCTAENLAEIIVELCERRDLVGVFHWAGAEVISRHALGLRIREHFKLPETQAPIACVMRAETPDAANKRQACLALDIAPLVEKVKTRPQTIAEQLTDLKVPPPCREWYFRI
jgi:dTDP-4-dehydrorhamnose reductase